VERMAKDLGVNVAEFIGADALVDRIELTKYASDDVGMPTLRDIAAELKKPGRDPRAAFEPPAFRDDIQKPSDLLPGMVLEGVVTNIVAFGAFVDIGVHQDGLVHVSQLSDRYIKDANDVVKVGQKVKVTVQNVDLPRNRIALSMRSDGGTSGARAGVSGEGGTRRDVQDNNRNTRDGGRPGQRGPSRGAAPAAKPFVPTKGAIAPNGIRFK